MYYSFKINKKIFIERNGGLLVADSILNYTINEREKRLARLFQLPNLDGFIRAIKTRDGGNQIAIGGILPLHYGGKCNYFTGKGTIDDKEVFVKAPTGQHPHIMNIKKRFEEMAVIAKALSELGFIEYYGHTKIADKSGIERPALVTNFVPNKGKLTYMTDAMMKMLLAAGVHPIDGQVIAYNGVHHLVDADFYTLPRTYEFDDVLRHWQELEFEMNLGEIEKGFNG